MQQGQLEGLGGILQCPVHVTAIASCRDRVVLYSPPVANWGLQMTQKGTTYLHVGPMVAPGAKRLFCRVWLYSSEVNVHGWGSK